MSFLTSPWFFPPVLAAGLWLAYRLYLKFAAPLSTRSKWSLALLTALAWLLLAGIIVQPVWNFAPVIFHPPVIAIAIDESPSFAAGKTLGSAEVVRKNAQGVRKFYEQKGFRILNLIFGEVTRPADSPAGVGTLSSVSSVRTYLDSLAIPNLQGVFIWTDGRWNLDAGEGFDAWPAPVFPMLVPDGTFGEVQGERVEAEFSDPDSGAQVSVQWRVLGNIGGRAKLELQSRGKTFSREFLPNPDATFGGLLRHRFRVPAGAIRGLGEKGVGEKWTALIRPEGKTENVTEKNDTVEVSMLGLHRNRQIFLGPLRSLEERGLVDAMFTSDSMEIVVTAPEALHKVLKEGGVLWARAQYASQALAIAKKAGAPLILYQQAEASSVRPASITDAGKVRWRDDAEKFFPGSVLSLADLGGNTQGWEFIKPGPSLEPIAWVEETRARGLMFARRTDLTTQVFEFAMPPLWYSRFQPEADDRIRRLQERWVQAVAKYAGAQGSPASPSAPTPPSILHPMDLEMSRLGIDDQKQAELALATHGAILPAGGDFTKLAALLPDLPRGEIQETNSKSTALLPMAASILILIGLLCAAWALRKKLHLD